MILHVTCGHVRQSRFACLHVRIPSCGGRMAAACYYKLQATVLQVAACEWWGADVFWRLWSGDEDQLEVGFEV